MSRRTRVHQSERVLQRDRETNLVVGTSVDWLVSTQFSMVLFNSSKGQTSPLLTDTTPTFKFTQRQTVKVNSFPPPLHNHLLIT